MKKIINFSKAIYKLPKAIYTYIKAVKRANSLYRQSPNRYFVLASSPDELIITSRLYQKYKRPVTITHNARTGYSKVATAQSMMTDCYYFTPNRSGKIPANYRHMLWEKFQTYIKHQLFFIKTGRK